MAGAGVAPSVSGRAGRLPAPARADPGPERAAVRSEHLVALGVVRAHVRAALHPDAGHVGEGEGDHEPDGRLLEQPELRARIEVMDRPVELPVEQHRDRDRHDGDREAHERPAVIVQAEQRGPEAGVPGMMCRRTCRMANPAPITAAISDSA